MLGIFAKSMMIATRMEDKAWVRDIKEDDVKRRADCYFWQGRKWQKPNQKKLSP